MEGDNKPILKCKTETVYTVHYRDLEDFVQSIYGGDYEFVAVQECGNNESHKFRVDGKLCYWPGGEVNDYNVKKADSIRLGKYPNYCNNLIFDCLFVDGYIPTGTYLVQVSW